MNNRYDIVAVRAAFPALATTDMAFFDNAGGAQVLGAVATRVADHLLTTSVQHGASYATSIAASERLIEARAALAMLVNARDPREIVMGSSATALVQNLARAIGHRIGEGDEILVSEADHEANIGPWRALAAARGATLVRWPVEHDTGLLDKSRLATLLTERTKLVAFTQATNLLGAIHPVREMVRIVREAGALSVVDGVAYAAHRAVDVQELDSDFYLVSLYKLFGPHQGLLWGRLEHWLDAASLNHRFIAADDLPYKLQPGHQNYELSWGAAAIPAYLAQLGNGSDRAALERGYDAIASYEATLVERLLGFLQSKQRVRILGPATAKADTRVATIGFTVDGTSPASIIAATDAAHVGIRYGNFYAVDLAQALGLSGDGMIRVSMAHYNTIEEVDRLITALDPVL